MYHVFAEIRISLNLMFIKLEVTPLSLVHIQIIFGCQIPSPSLCLLEILHFFRPGGNSPGSNSPDTKWNTEGLEKRYTRQKKILNNTKK